MEEWAVVILFRMQTARSAGPYKTGPCGLNNTSREPFLCVVDMTDDAQSLEELCGTSMHADEAVQTMLQDQKFKHKGPRLQKGARPILSGSRGWSPPISVMPMVSWRLLYSLTSLLVAYIFIGSKGYLVCIASAGKNQPSNSVNS
jgi:hypothetical protein